MGQRYEPNHPVIHFPRRRRDPRRHPPRWLTGRGGVDGAENDRGNRIRQVQQVRHRESIDTFLDQVPNLQRRQVPPGLLFNTPRSHRRREARRLTGDTVGGGFFGFNDARTRRAQARKPSRLLRSSPDGSPGRNDHERVRPKAGHASADRSAGYLGRPPGR